MRWTLLLLTGLFLAGCDTDVEPFQESDLHFSIFGYLDAGADTQFVRVTPLRQTVDTQPAPVEGEVVLERLATGEQTVLQDSLFTFVRDRVAHNFWAPVRLVPGETYRFTATRPDGASSVATVQMPDDFPPPVLQVGFFIPPQVVIRGVERLADTGLIFHVRLPTGQPRSVSVSYLDDAIAFGDGFFFVVNLTEDLEEVEQRVGSSIELVRIEIMAASAGPDWPETADLDDETLALPGVVSNVENGLGFLGGVLVKRIPWGSSRDRGGIVTLDPCVIFHKRRIPCFES